MKIFRRHTVIILYVCINCKILFFSMSLHFTAVSSIFIFGMLFWQSNNLKLVKLDNLHSVPLKNSINTSENEDSKCLNLFFFFVCFIQCTMYYNVYINILFITNRSIQIHSLYISTSLTHLSQSVDWLPA